MSRTSFLQHLASPSLCFTFLPCLAFSTQATAEPTTSLALPETQVSGVSSAQETALDTPLPAG